MPILVLRRSPDVLSHTGLAIARSAGRWGIDVHGVREDPGAPTRLSRYAGRCFELAPNASDDRWRVALAQIGRELGRTVLVPIDDLAAVFVGDHAAELEEHFLFAHQPPALSRRLSDKGQLHRLCDGLGIAQPGAVFPSDEGDVRDYTREGDFPVVVKRMHGERPARAANAPSVRIAYTAEQLIDAYRAMDSDQAPNVMLQEFVPGTSDTVWMFNGYFDERSRCLFGATGRKIRQRGPRTGPTTLGICQPNEAVGEMSRRLMHAVGYHGIVDLGCRYDARDGAFKLLDVNPRLGSSFRLFVGEDGMDVLRALYLDLTSRPVPPAHPRPGRRWLVEPYDVVAAAQLARDGELDMRRWLHSLRGVDECAWFASDDPGPALGMAARMIVTIFARMTGHRAGGRPSGARATIGQTISRGRPPG